MQKHVRSLAVLVVISMIMLATARPVQAQFQSPVLSQLPGVVTQIIGSIFGSRPELVVQPADERPQVVYGPEVLISVPVKGDLIVAGGTVTVDAAVDGDVIVAGGLVRLNAPIRGDVLGIGGVFNVAGAIENDFRVAGIGVNLESVIAKNAMIAAAFLRQAERSSINGSLLAASYRSWMNGVIGGNLDARGTDVVLNSAVGGAVNLNADTLAVQKNARVLEGITASLASEPLIDAGANVQGSVDITIRQVASESAVVEASQSGEPVVTPIPETQEQSFLRLLVPVAHAQENIVGERGEQLIKAENELQERSQAFKKLTDNFFGNVIATFIGGAVLLLIFPSFQKGQSAVLQKKLGMSAAIGWLWLTLGLLLSIALMITIIALPIGVAVLLIWIANMIIAPWVVAQALGSSVVARWQSQNKPLQNAYMQLFLGSVILSSLLLIPYLGWLFRILIWTIGMGAAITWLLKRNSSEFAVQSEATTEVATVVALPVVTEVKPAKTPAVKPEKKSSKVTKSSAKKSAKKA